MIALLLNRYSNLVRLGLLILAPLFLVTPESLRETSTQDKAETSYEWNLSENTVTRKNKKVHIHHLSKGSYLQVAERDQVTPFTSRTISSSTSLYLQHRNLRL